MMDAVELLKQLIACRSVTPEQAGALDIAQTMLADAGFQTQRLPAGKVDNLWAANAKPPALIFAGHVDVVPVGDLSLWQTDPFQAVEQDGYVYGRGAADMKSGVAAMLCAACALQQSGIGGVGVLLTSDEEGKAVDGTLHVANWMRENDFRARFVIVGEPTCNNKFGDSLKTGRRGSLTARIKVRGKQTHAAYPQRGDNPNHRLLPALKEVLARFERQNKKQDEIKDGFPPTSMQIIALQSGVGADNVVPPSADALINFRYAPSDSAEGLRQMVETHLQTAAPDSWECEWEHGAEPFSTAQDGALVQAVQNAAREVCGQTPVPNTAGGSSDGRFLYKVCDELLEFGVMNETMHEPNERVLAESVRQLADVYERTARRLLAG